MRNAASSIALGGGSAAGGLTVTSGSDAGGVPIFLPAFPAYGRASREPKLTHLSRRTRKNWPSAHRVASAGEAMMSAAMINIGLGREGRFSIRYKTTHSYACGSGTNCYSL